MQNVLVICRPAHVLRMRVPRAIFLPLQIAKRDFRALGIAFKYQYGTREIAEADTVIVDCKLFYRRPEEEILEYLENLRRASNRIIWLDNRDSAGNVQFEVLPFVDCYWKNQIYSDLSHYDHPYFANRIFTDFMVRHYQLNPKEQDSQLPLSAVSEHAHKISISWNLGFGDYVSQSPFGELTRRLFMRNFSPKFSSPETPREIDVHLRFSLGDDATYSAHRRAVSSCFRESKLNVTMPGKLPKREFTSELQQAKIAVSPFGWGEVCYRDFEAVIHGACLVKPDMGHLSTWPDIYRPYETYVPVRWDLSDLTERVGELLTDHRLRVELVRNAQDVLKSAYSSEGVCRFAHEKAELLSGAE